MGLRPGAICEKSVAKHGFGAPGCLSDPGFFSSPVASQSAAPPSRTTPDRVSVSLVVARSPDRATGPTEGLHTGLHTLTLPGCPLAWQEAGWRRTIPSWNATESMLTPPSIT